jgi:hypothetical protein
MVNRIEGRSDAVPVGLGEEQPAGKRKIINQVKSREKRSGCFKIQNKFTRKLTKVGAKRSKLIFHIEIPLKRSPSFVFSTKMY